jgi:glutathione S-transferase
MALEFYWGSGSAYSWRVLLSLEHKQLAYVSHLLAFSRQEPKSPQMLKLNPRGQVPVLKDGDYVIFESLAILHYLDRQYPQHPLFGFSPREAGTIIRVVCEFQSYIEPHVNEIVHAIFHGELAGRKEKVTQALHAVAREARTIEGRLSRSDWIVGEQASAADFVIFPSIMLLQRAIERDEATELRSRLLPLQVHYPALARWIARVEALPGYERTYPPHWRV